MNLTNPTLPPVTDLDALRTAVASALSNLVTQLNQSAVTDNFDVGGNRVTNVATPTGPNDAVNKRYLHSVVGTTTNIGKKGNGSGKDAYTVVFSDSTTVGAGDVIPVFIVGSDRIGVPEEVWVYAVQAPGSGGLVLNITHNTTNILTTALTLGSGSNGPVYSYSLTGGIKFNHGDIIQPVISTSAAASVVSIGVVVRRT
jgi:hypothetical protein